MRSRGRLSREVVGVIGMLWGVGFPGLLAGQATLTADFDADSEWAQLPDGREWGAVTGVYPDPDGLHMWVMDRCGQNDCIGSELDPLFRFDLEGRLVNSMGAGLLAWPHGLFVDHEGNVWVTDGGTGSRGVAASLVGLGHQVLKLSPEGDVLLTLGTPGVAGRGPYEFEGPSVVLVAEDGHVFVADGHDAGGNNRIVKFAPDGAFLQAWGVTGPGPAAGEMRDPHALAMDSAGRLFVSDRGNTRIQIFDQSGVFLEHWTQFGPASDIYIDENDVMYVTDAPSVAAGWVGELRSSTWERGIRIGDARTGRVTGFIASEAEFAVVDRLGNIYGAEVQGTRLVRYSRAQVSPARSNSDR